MSQPDQCCNALLAYRLHDETMFAKLCPIDDENVVVIDGRILETRRSRKYQDFFDCQERRTESHLIYFAA